MAYIKNRILDAQNVDLGLIVQKIMKGVIHKWCHTKNQIFRPLYPLSQNFNANFEVLYESVTQSQTL